MKQLSPQLQVLREKIFNCATNDGSYRIYTISHKGIIFYVGCTRGTLWYRALGHLSSARCGASLPVSIKIKKIMDLGELLDFEILETVYDGKLNALKT